MTASREQDFPKMRQAIAERAKQYGNKSANLQELKIFCEQLRDAHAADIPEIEPLSHELIEKHLDAHASTWRNLWQDFKEVQGKETQLTAKAKEVLKKLRQLISNAFNKHPLDKKILENYFRAVGGDALLMVRSSGKEDTVECANPGGNKSIAAVKANETDVSQAIGKVVASYFSEKSLSQRLTSNDDITQDPLLSVLLQKMIGEPLNGAAHSDEIVRSGVMYTSTVDVRIQLAPGHGSYTVDSLGPCDSCLVTRENVVHLERVKKENRLVPVEVDDKHATHGKKRKLNMKKNPADLVYADSISESVAQRIAAIGRLITEHYGMPMDVEFVYHPKQDQLFIVQARPVPKSSVRIDPSSVPPDKMATVKQHAELIKDAIVVTTDCFTAQVITKKEEILVCHSISTALTKYLEEQKNSTVKAVIIQEPSAGTSHEAAKFNSQSIPVLQVPNIQRLDEWLSRDNVVIVVDPQRGQVINWTKQTKNHAHAMEELFEEKRGILKRGRYRSPMPPISLPLSHSPKTAFFEKLKASGKLAFSKENLSNEKLGDLIERAKSSDSVTSECAVIDLSNVLYHILSDLPVKPIDSKNLYTDMVKNLEALEGAKAGAENKEALAALNSIIVGFNRLAHSNAAMQRLQKHALILSAEIVKCLQRFSSIEHKDSHEEIQKELLGLVARLESLVRNPGVSNAMTSSVLQVVTAEKEIKHAKEIHKSLSSSKEGKEEKDLDEEQLAFFVEMLRFGKLSLSKRVEKEWNVFVLEACQDAASRQLLSGLMLFNSRNGIASDWLNTSFVSALEKSRQLKQKPVTLLDVTLRAMQKERKLGPEMARINMKEILASLKEESKETAKELVALDLSRQQEVMSRWERRIAEWASPDKFGSLWDAWGKEFLPLINQFNFDEKMQPLTKKTILRNVLQLTDVIDRTIKALKGGPDYKGNESLQVRRFAQLLVPYYDLMRKWVSKIPKEKFEEWSVGIDEPARRANSKDNILLYIADAFGKRRSSTDAKELNPSRQFSAESTKIGSSGSFYRQFIEIIDSLTLEDLFTLFHQNMIVAIVYFLQDSQLKKENLPEVLKPLIESFDAVILKSFDNRLTVAPIQLELLSIYSQYPKLYIEYNLPLRNHSGKFTLEYDQESRKIVLHAKIFARNTVSRMSIIASMAEIESSLLAVETLKAPRYDSQTNLFEFDWRFSEKQISQLANPFGAVITAYGETTFALLGYIPYRKLLSRYPGREIELISIVVQGSSSHFDSYSAILDYVMNNLDKFDRELIKELIKKISNFTSLSQWKEIFYNDRTSAAQIVESVNILFDYLKNELPSILLEKDNESYTILERFIALPYFTMEDKKLDDINIKDHPHLVNIALAKTDVGLMKKLMTLEANFPILDDEAIENGFKDPYLSEIIIKNILKNPTYQKITARKGMVKRFLSNNKESKDAESTVESLLDLGAPIELAVLPLLEENQHSRLINRYFTYFKDNAAKFKFERQSKLISRNVNNPIMVLRLIDLKVPFENLAVSHVIMLLNHQNDLVTKYCMEYLSNNAKKEVYPRVTDVVARLMEGDTQHDLLLVLLNKENTLPDGFHLDNLVKILKGPHAAAILDKHIPEDRIFKLLFSFSDGSYYIIREIMELSVPHPKLRKVICDLLNSYEWQKSDKYFFNKEFRNNSFKLGYVPDDDDLMFTDYIKFNYDKEKKGEPLKSVSEAIKDGDLQGIQFYLDRGISYYVATYYFILFALMHKKTDVAVSLLSENMRITNEMAVWAIDNGDDKLWNVVLANDSELPLTVYPRILDEKLIPQTIHDIKVIKYRSDQEVDLLSYVLESKKVDLALRIVKSKNYQLPVSSEHLERMKKNVIATGNVELQQELEKRNLKFDSVSPRLSG